MSAGDFRRYIGSTVLVQLDDYALKGNLSAATATTLTVDAPELLDDEGHSKELIGVVVIDRLRVQWVQVPD